MVASSSANGVTASISARKRSRRVAGRQCERRDDGPPGTDFDHRNLSPDVIDGIAGIVNASIGPKMPLDQLLDWIVRLQRNQHGVA